MIRNTNQEATYKSKAAALKEIEYGLAAAHFLKEGNGEGVDLALGKIRYDEANLKERAMKSMAGTERGRIDATKIYNSLYSEAFSEFSISDLGDFYGSLLGNHTKIKEIFGSEAFEGKTVHDANGDMYKAGTVLDAPEFYSDRQVKSAEKTQAKYNHFARATKILNSRKTSRMVNEIREEVEDKGLAKIVTERKAA